MNNKYIQKQNSSKLPQAGKINRKYEKDTKAQNANFSPHSNVRSSQQILSQQSPSASMMSPIQAQSASRQLSPTLNLLQIVDSGTDDNSTNSNNNDQKTLKNNLANYDIKNKNAT